MSQLKIDTNWMEICVADRPEIQCTYAQLSISVGGDIVTTVHHRNSDTVSNTILVSLYPLAEWIVGNWWLLTEETELPGRKGFMDRHALRDGRGGYCMPDLRFIPEGDSIRVEWVPYKYAHAPMHFVAQGTERLSKDHVKEVLWDVVDKVDQRLTKSNILDTWMQKEWSGVQETLQDNEETTFCRAAAWLGLDPYEMADARADEFVSLYNKIPQCLREDTLKASAEPDASEIGNWISKALSQRPSNGETPPTLQRLRTTIRGKGQSQPWKLGYRLASKVRQVYNMNGLAPVRVEAIFDGALPIAEATEAPKNVDALCFLDGSLACHTAKRRPDSKRFIVARTLYDYLATDAEYSLLTLARTERQQEGRAFAAELLAPADALRQRIHREIVTEDEVLELASEFSVSSRVIEHQIKNHQIAEVLGY